MALSFPKNVRTIDTETETLWHTTSFPKIRDGVFAAYSERSIGFKIINLARLEGGSCIGIPRRPITQSKLIILTPIPQMF
jgi:hypothetical protein